MHLQSLISVTLLFAIAISVARAGDPLHDTKRDCYIEVVCETQDGYFDVLDCCDKMTPKDQEYAKDAYRKFVGDDANEFDTLVRISCNNRELADNASTTYMELRRDESDKFTLEENKKYDETKICFSNVIDNCIREKGVSVVG